LDVGAVAHFLKRDVHVYSQAHGWSRTGMEENQNSKPFYLLLEDNIHWQALVDGMLEMK